jgi:hypothetical protein
LVSPPNTENPLYKLFLDGRPGWPPIHRWHHYFEVYHRHFAPFRDRQPTILEIGVQNGGSLRLWQEYFGDGAKIFGMDVDPQCKDRAPPGTTVFIGDQADPNFLREIIAKTGAPDIIIDDGGHTANQMIVSFETLYPLMKPIGIYLVEDTHTQFWGGKFSDDPSGRNFVGYAGGLAVALHDWTRNAKNFPKLSLPLAKRKEALPASYICRTTTSVCFYDSIVVLTRRPRPEPWSELRTYPPKS